MKISHCSWVNSLFYFCISSLSQKLFHIKKLLKHLSQIQGKPWESAGNSFFGLGEEPSLDGQEASNDIQIFWKEIEPLIYFA